MSAPELERPVRDDSFDALYRGHVRDVYRYSLPLVRDPVDAEDVTQSTFLNAWRAYSTDSAPRMPRPWLIAIARNICRERHRRSLSRPRVSAMHELPAQTADDHGVRADEIVSA